MQTLEAPSTDEFVRQPPSLSPVWCWLVRHPLLTFIGVLVLTVMGAQLLLRGFSAIVVANYQSPADAWTTETVEVVNQWLESQRRGESGTEFWLDDAWVSPTRLYSVSDWKVVDAEMTNVKVLVDSSSGAGEPIRQLWNISLSTRSENLLTDKQDMRIISVEAVD